MIAAILSFGCRAHLPASPAGGGETAAEAEYEAWRLERLAGLQKDDGWLALAGLHWLKEGEAPIGSARDNAVVLPKSAPPRLGVLTMRERTVELSIADGVEATAGGAPFHSGTIFFGADPKAEPVRVRVGDVTLTIIDRGGELALRVHDAQAKTRLEFRGIETFPWDARWVVRARFEPFETPKKVAVPTVIGIDDEATVPGALVFELDGAQRRLEPFQEEGDNELFIVFADETNGKETYGGGRFLTAKLKADGSDVVVLDFNRAISPPCAFTPYATCPVPRPENRLRTAVEAGEKSRAHGAEE